MAVGHLKMVPVRTSFESPWQNGAAERQVENCRRDLQNHVTAVKGQYCKENKRLIRGGRPCKSLEVRTSQINSVP